MTLRATLFILLCTAVVFVVGCDGSTASAGANADGSKKLQIVATVAMVGDVAAAVAGDDAEVTTLVGTGVDPHLYRPTRDDVRKLHDADIILYSGYHLEGRMAEMLEQISQRKTAVPVAERANIGMKLDERSDSYDPHAWMDPQRWQHTADVIAATLATARPDRAEVYAARAAEFKRQAMALHEYGQRIMQTVPPERRVLVTSHDAFGYLGSAYGIRQLGLQGISTDSEASLKTINDVAAEVVRLKVPAVFIESSVPPKGVQALVDSCASQGHRVTIGGELFSDAMGPAGTYEGTYIGMIDHNLTTIARALGGDAPERGLNGKLSPHAASH